VVPAATLGAPPFTATEMMRLKRLAFLSAREGGSQVWALDLAGGEPRKLTSLATRGADGPFQRRWE
jgi:hypothetical protein